MVLARDRNGTKGRVIVSSISFISQGWIADRAWKGGSVGAAARATLAQPDVSSIAADSDTLAAALDATIESSANESLLNLQIRLDSSIASSNALATAAGAIMQIGNAIDTIQKALHPPDRSNQAASGSSAADSQPTIDTALNSLDSISASSKFLGRALLDGTYSSSGQTIPPLRTQTLGSSGTAAALDTLFSGGPNDLASGNLSAATSIASAAAQQIGSVAQLVDALRSVAVGTALLGVESGPSGIYADRTPDLAAVLTLAQQAGAMMLTDSSRSSVAVANAPAAHVLAMI